MRNRCLLLALCGSFVGLVAILLLTTLYFFAAEQQARSNVKLTSVDQAAMMGYAQKMAQTDYATIGGRNRMPVFPFFLSLIYQPDLSDEAFFERSKTFSLILSGLVLAVLFLIFLKQFHKLWYAALLTLLLAFSLFVYRAGFIQAELFFYLLSFALFLALIDQLRRPTWPKAIFTGILLGIAHLTKASILPALMLFFFVAVLKEGYTFYRARQTDPSYAAYFDKYTQGRLLALALVGITFLITVYPYISTSKRVFGTYFYNVNSTFYIWYDSWHEVTTGTRAHGDRAGWPTMPPEELPSAGKYFGEHTWGQILGRFRDGFWGLVEFARLPYRKYILIYLGLLLGVGLWRYRQIRQDFTADTFFGFLFVGGYFSGYALLYLWYYPIAPGPQSDRFILALFIPLLYSVSKVVFAYVTPGVNASSPLIFLTGGALMLLIAADIHTALQVTNEADYYAAYDRVAEQRGPDDLILLHQTVLCYGSALPCDYHLVEVNHDGLSPLIGLFNQTAPAADWLHQPAALDWVLTGPRPAWLIIHQRDLQQAFSPNFIQQIFGQMDFVQVVNDEVLIFRTRPTVYPFPQRPSQLVEGRWESETQLLGFEQQRLPDDQLLLTLFWRHALVVNDYKTFIHLRSLEGGNIAQADYTPLDHIPYHYRVLANPPHALFRNQVLISLPPQTDLAQNRLIVGLYHVASGQRVPVIDDQSGEHGVWLEPPTGP